MNLFEIISKVFYYLIIIPISIGFLYLISINHGLILFLILLGINYIFYVIKYNRQTMESIQNGRINCAKIKAEKEGKGISEEKMLEHRLRSSELIKFTLCPFPATKGNGKDFFVEWDKFATFILFSLIISIVLTLIIDKTDVLNKLLNNILK